VELGGGRIALAVASRLSSGALANKKITEDKSSSTFLKFLTLRTHQLMAGCGYERSKGGSRIVSEPASSVTRSLWRYYAADGGGGSPNHLHTSTPSALLLSPFATPARGVWDRPKKAKSPHGS
jgi:hypothetical protein